LATLVSFDDFTNGAYPNSLVQASDGSFYGTTLGSTFGAYRFGTVFKLTSGVLTTLVSFDGHNGSTPAAALALGRDGDFYGATEFGGTNGDGTLFKMTPDGTLTTLVAFDHFSNGANPYAGLVQATDANFYGTTEFGGTQAGYGTVFKMTRDGQLTTLLSFEGANGSLPVAALVQGGDGSFYGSTLTGGASTNANLFGTTNANIFLTRGYGTLFKMNPDGALTTLVSFNGTNGAYPNAALIQGSDGDFYGTTYLGGTNGGQGTVFKMAPNGSLITLVSFNGTNGSRPLAALIQGSDGDFYGTTSYGGAYGGGTVFRLSVPSAPSPKVQTASKSGNTFTLTWGALSRRKYQVQFTTNLAQTAWKDLGSAQTATNSAATASDTIDSDRQRLYRVVLLP
jgi:uncharacterized repeat protein (TIGR03803 family)